MLYRKISKWLVVLFILMGVLMPAPTAQAAAVHAARSLVSRTMKITPQVGSLSGFAYVDANHNSVFDSGETPLQSVTITVSVANGSPLTTSTDATGHYIFASLAAGTHLVSAPGSAGILGLVTTSPLSALVVVSTETKNVNFGYAASAIISGHVYTDLNQNQTKDGGDTSLGGVTVTLVGTGGTTSTTADSNGFYSFTNLPGGTYTVSVPATSGAESEETTNPLTIVLTGGQNSSNNDFGYVVQSISGTLYTDTNNNGVLNAWEPALAGGTVTLNGSLTTTTDANGNYVFANLPTGPYTITAPSSAQSEDLETSSPLNVLLLPGQSNLGNNFGYVTGSLSGTLYNDANKTSSLDSGEGGLSGVTVTISGPGGTHTTTTDLNGNYTFTGLQAGSYSVSVPSTADGEGLETTNPLTGTVNVGQNYSGVNFGYVTGSLAGIVYAD